jgi:hypothetical protein
MSMYTVWLFCLGIYFVVCVWLLMLYVLFDLLFCMLRFVCFFQRD